MPWSTATRAPAATVTNKGETDADSNETQDDLADPDPGTRGQEWYGWAHSQSLYTTRNEATKQAAHVASHYGWETRVVKVANE
jgi:hypothetical protein